MKGKTQTFIIKDGKAVPIDKIPEGAIRVHLYNFKEVLKPRGSMEKESLGLSIYERLTAAFEYWTDPAYGDNPEPSDLIKQLRENLASETHAAWVQLFKDINKNKEER